MSDKFRIWDSNTLNEAAKLSLQLTQKIEELCQNSDLDPADLPESLLSTDKLYLLAIAYNAAYKKLTEYDLLKSGNPKQTKGTH